MSISFCLIAKNESQVISGSIRSILNIADEIVVGIDDRTTDGTDEIVRKFGIKPFYFHWINDFAFVRNLTMNRASCDHVFILDPDERLTQQGQQLVNIILHQSSEPDDAYAFNIRNTTLAGKLIQVTLGPIRLVPNKPEIRYQYSMHETLMNPGQVHYMPIEAIEHVGFDSQLQKPSIRGDRNERMLLDRILHNFNDADSWRYLSFWYRYIGNNSDAAICAEEALRLPGRFNPGDIETLKIIRSDSYEVSEDVGHKEKGWQGSN